MLKTLIKRTVLTNSFLSEYVNKIYHYKNLNYMKKLLSKFSYDDSINNVENIRNFRMLIEEKGIIESNNINFWNSHIYGIWDNLYGKLNIDVIKTPSIEHGLFFNNQIYSDFLYTCRASYTTFGDFRFNIIRKFSKLPIFCVGPYINYANAFYDGDKFNKLKKTLGKTLLVFPTHSISKSILLTNEKKYIELLREKSKSFNSVLVCVFWWNINDPLIKKLESEGYKIVSAGFCEDIMFIRRLKTIISLADLVIGDSIGTHIGYCFACNISFCYEEFDSKLMSLDRTNFAEIEMQKIKDVFLHATEITSEQREIVRYYWGTDHIRTREELCAMAEICRDITEMSYGWQFLFYKNACKLLKKYEKTDEMKYRLLKEALK